MRKLLWTFFATLSMTASASTVTVQLNNLAATPAQATASSVRVDLQNCPAPRIPTVGFLQQKTWSFSPNSAGLVTATLYQNSLINCGQTSNSYYTFNFVSNGTVSSLGSYIIPAGTSDLSTLTPIYTTPTVTPPTGDNTYLRLDLGNFGNLVQPIPNLAANSLTSESYVNSQTATFSQSEQSAVDNNVINPTLYPGTDLAQQVPAAIAANPTLCPIAHFPTSLSSAQCTVKIPPGNYTITSGELYIPYTSGRVSLIMTGATLNFSGSMDYGIEIPVGQDNAFLYGGQINMIGDPSCKAGIVLDAGGQGMFISNVREVYCANGDGLVDFGMNVVNITQSAFGFNLIGVHLLGSAGYASNAVNISHSVIGQNKRSAIVDGDISQYPIGWYAGNGQRTTAAGVSSPNFNNHFIDNDLEVNGTTSTSSLYYPAVLTALTIGDEAAGNYHEATPYLQYEAGCLNGTDSVYTTLYGTNTVGPNCGTSIGFHIHDNYFTTSGGAEILLNYSTGATVESNTENPATTNSCFVAGNLSGTSFINNNSYTGSNSEFCNATGATNPSTWTPQTPSQWSGGPNIADTNIGLQGDMLIFNYVPHANLNLNLQALIWSPTGPPVPLNPNNPSANPNCTPAFAIGTTTVDTTSGVTWQCVADTNLIPANSDGSGKWVPLTPQNGCTRLGANFASMSAVSACVLASNPTAGSSCSTYPAGSLGISPTGLNQCVGGVWVAH